MPPDSILTAPVPSNAMPREARLPILALLLLAALAPAAAAAEVVVELHDHPLTGGLRPAPAPAGVEASPALGSLFGASNVPTGAIWFAPRFKVDRTAFGDTTLWSIRNEGLAPVNVTVEYFDAFFILQHSDPVTLEPHQILPVNVRDVPGLAADPDGFARGMVRFTPNGPISVDVLQVDTSENFASGELGFVTDDFCTEWQVRFLSFGANQGSVASFLVNGPWGAGGGDPPTVTGDVYNEQGSFLNSFTVRTDEWFFDLDLLDFVLGGERFGSMEVVLSPRFSPAGLINVAHSAEGRFSVGLRAVCRDGL